MDLSLYNHNAAAKPNKINILGKFNLQKKYTLY